MDVDALAKISTWVLKHMMPRVTASTLWALHRVTINNLWAIRPNYETRGLQMKQQSYSHIEFLNNPTIRMLPPPELCGSLSASPIGTPPFSGSSSNLADEEVANITSPSSCYTHNDALDDSGSFLPVPVNDRQHELWMELHRRLHEDSFEKNMREENGNERSSDCDVESEEDFLYQDVTTEASSDYNLRREEHKLHLDVGTEASSSCDAESEEYDLCSDLGYIDVNGYGGGSEDDGLCQAISIKHTTCGIQNKEDESSLEIDTSQEFEKVTSNEDDGLYQAVGVETFKIENAETVEDDFSLEVDNKTFLICSGIVHEKANMEQELSKGISTGCASGSEDNRLFEIISNLKVDDHLTVLNSSDFVSDDDVLYLGVEKQTFNAGSEKKDPSILHEYVPPCHMIR